MNVEKQQNIKYETDERYDYFEKGANYEIKILIMIKSIIPVFTACRKRIFYPFYHVHCIYNFTLSLIFTFIILFEFCIGISYSDLLVFINRILGITVKIFTQRNRWRLYKILLVKIPLSINNWQ
jgi:hypothetical protein